MTATMMRPDLDAIEARARGTKGEDDVWDAVDYADHAREDVPALLAYVRELEGGLAALRATLGGGPGVPLDGEALDAWMLGGG